MKSVVVVAVVVDACCLWCVFLSFLSLWLCTVYCVWCVDWCLFFVIVLHWFLLVVVCCSLIMLLIFVVWFVPRVELQNSRWGRKRGWRAEKNSAVWRDEVSWSVSVFNEFFRRQRCFCHHFARRCLLRGSIVSLGKMMELSPPPFSLAPSTLSDGAFVECVEGGCVKKARWAFTTA